MYFWFMFSCNLLFYKDLHILYEKSSVMYCTNKYSLNMQCQVGDVMQGLRVQLVKGLTIYVDSTAAAVKYD